MAINSRAKGAAGEREFAKYLTESGFSARRGCQFSGSPDSPDVVCPALTNIHWEIKRVERLNVDAAMAQAIRDSKGQRTPVVAHRKNNADWLITLRADDFFSFISFVRNGDERDAEEPSTQQEEVKEEKGEGGDML